MNDIFTVYIVEENGKKIATISHKEIGIVNNENLIFKSVDIANKNDFDIVMGWTTTDEYFETWKKTCSKNTE